MKLAAIFFLGFMVFCIYAKDARLENLEKSLENQRSLLKSASIEEVQIFPQSDDASEHCIMRRGTLLRYPNAVATILLCHGFLCSKEDIACFRSIFQTGLFNFLTFDFRGHGQDIEGQISSLGLHEAHDVIAAARFIREHIDETLRTLPLIVWGFSMGAVASIRAQAKNTSLFDAMIVDCPFSSSDELVKNSFDQMKFTVWGKEFDVPGRSILQKYALHPYVQSFMQQLLKVVLNWDTKHVKLQVAPINLTQLMESISVPCFFIHCRNDQKVPLDSVKQLYDKAAGYKRLWITNGRRHFDSFFDYPEQYTYRVNKFLNEVLSGSLHEKNKEKIINHAKT